MFTQIARMFAARQRFRQDAGHTDVRKAPVGLSVSVGLHLVAVVYVTTRSEAHVRPLPHPVATTVEIVPAPATPPPAPPTPEPVGIALLDAATTRALTELPAPRNPVHAPARSRDAAITAHAATTVETPDRAPDRKGHSLMEMRHPEIAVDMSRGFVDDFLGHSKPLEPEIEATLAPAGNAGYRSDQGVFTAKIDRDGSVHLTDAANFNWHGLLPTPTKIKHGLATWAENPEAGKADPEREPINNHRAASQDTRPDHGQTVPIIGGGFDVSDWMMRRHGGDPYASKKLKMLDDTRDERVQIGSKYRREQLRQTPQLIQKNLERLWGSTLDAAARKQALFELWDECAETGEPSVVDAGRAARALVIGFIRARLPAGTPDAYTTDELARLATARQSQATFAPYD
jgi:hypothetical protein